MTASTVLGAAAVLLSGCADGPSYPMTTLIHEVDGVSAFESDVFVQAAREADLGRVLAWNTLDFTRSELTSTNSADAVATLYLAAVALADGAAAPYVFAGPALWLPVEVTVDESGEAAEITACAPNREWVLTGGQTNNSYDLTDASLVTLRVVTDAESGELVFDGSTSSSEACDATGAPVVRVSPVPGVPVEIDRAAIVAPGKFG